MNPIFALIITNLIWGAASPIFKYSLQNIPPFILAFIRFFFASLIFLPFMIKQWQPISLQQLFRIFLVGVFGVTINISFFFLGLQLTESINAPIIASSGPVFIYLLSIIFLKERPKRKVFTGMMISLIGVLIIIISPIFLNQQEYSFGAIEGNLFFLLATLGCVLSTVFGKDILKEVNPIIVTGLSFAFSSLTFTPFALSELSHWSFNMIDIKGLIGIVFGVFFSSALAYFFYYYGISKIKAQEVGIFAYIDPIVAVIIAIPLLHEYPNLFFFIGAILVIGGIFLAEGRLNWHPLHKLKNNKS